MKSSLEEYYNKYHGLALTGSNDGRFKENKFAILVEKWRSECSPKTVQVGGKTYKMTLIRWIKRLEKSAKSQINEARREKRKESLRENEGKYYHTQPTMKTIPLHQDLGFLKGLMQQVIDAEKWNSNKDDTAKTLVLKTRAWYKSELARLITLETIRNPV